MNLTLTIPDALASRLIEAGPKLERQALEALMLENFRSGRLTLDELRNALGFEALNQVDGFLKAHGVYEAYSADEIKRQVETLAELGF